MKKPLTLLTLQMVTINGADAGNKELNACPMRRPYRTRKVPRNPAPALPAGLG